MDTGVGLHLALCTWLLISAQIQIIVEAEITCASCGSPVKINREELQLDKRVDLVERRATLLKDIRKESQRPTDLSSETGVAVGAEDFAEDMKESDKDVSMDGVDMNVSPDSSPQVSEKVARSNYETITEGNKLSEIDSKDTIQRQKRSGPELSELNEGVKSGSALRDGAPSDDRITGSLLDGERLSRPELRWNRDDGKVQNPRQDEPKLISTTFALTGDSAHNQAMVFWSGHNSSITVPNRRNSPLKGGSEEHRKCTG